MGMKIIRLSDAAFVGDDGQEVLGMYVYLVPNGNVGQPERVFLSEKKMEDILQWRHGHGVHSDHYHCR